MGAATALVTIVAAWRGATVEGVGLLLAGFAAAQLVALLLGGRLGDTWGRRPIVQTGLAIATLGALASWWSTTATGLAAAQFLLGLGAGFYPPALVSLAYDEDRKLGRFTAWGSLGLALGAVIAVLGVTVGAARTSGPRVFALATVLYALAFVASLTIARRPEHRVRVPLFPVKVMARNMPVVGGLLLRHTGATAAYAVLPLYLLSLGGHVALVPAVTVVTGLGQFLVMQRIDGAASHRLFLVGLTVSAVAFGLTAVATNAWWALGAQLVLAGGWSCLYVGALKAAMEDNAERATATGLIKGTLQAASVAGPLLGGVVAAAFGYRAVMVAAVILAVAALPVARLRFAPAPEPTPPTTPAVDAVPLVATTMPPVR